MKIFTCCARGLIRNYWLMPVLIHVSQLHKKPMCFVTDNANVFILLLFVAQHIQDTVFLHQHKNSDIDGITYHNISSVSDYIGAEICEILPCFHALTSSDYANLFFGRTKVHSFKRKVLTPSSLSLLSSMKLENADIPAVISLYLN